MPFYRAVFNVSATGTVQEVPVSAVAPTYSNGLMAPPPVTGPCIQTNPPNFPVCNPEDIEAQIDTEQTGSLAPNARVNFYLAYNPNECFVSGTCAPGTGTPVQGINPTGINIVDDELQQIVNDNVADVVSVSYGTGELDFASPTNPLLQPCVPSPTTCPTGGQGVEPTLFASLASEGIAVFVSSGDTGAESCIGDGPPNQDKVCASYPSSDPNVVSMGGTTTPINNSGRLNGLVTVWGVQTQTGMAAGGGYSSVFTRPAGQPAGTFCADDLVSCDATHRLLPDLALNADSSTGDAVTINCGTGPSCVGLGGPLIGVAGGTSLAAPDMAAMWALVLEACKQTASCATHTWPGAHPYRLGNPAPLLYMLSPAQQASAFYDIVYGLNAVPPAGGAYPSLDPAFNATPGYDLASGLGAPFARNLIKAVVGI